jgi:hypothetical protein
MSTACALARHNHCFNKFILFFAFAELYISHFLLFSLFNRWKISVERSFLF